MYKIDGKLDNWINYFRFLDKNNIGIQLNDLGMKIPGNEIEIELIFINNIKYNFTVPLNPKYDYEFFMSIENENVVFWIDLDYLDSYYNSPIFSSMPYLFWTSFLYKSIKSINLLSNVVLKSVRELMNENPSLKTKIDELKAKYNLQNQNNRINYQERSETLNWILFDERTRFFTLKSQKGTRKFTKTFRILDAKEFDDSNIPKNGSWILTFFEEQFQFMRYGPKNNKFQNEFIPLDGLLHFYINLKEEFGLELINDLTLLIVNNTNLKLEDIVKLNQNTNVHELLRKFYDFNLFKPNS